MHISVCNGFTCQALVTHRYETCGPNIVCDCPRTCPKCRGFEVVLENRLGMKRVALTAIRFAEKLCAEGEVEGVSPSQLRKKRQQEMQAILNEAKSLGLII